MSNLVPYRSLAQVEKYEEEKKPKFGFLKGKPDMQPHQCQLPTPTGFFASLLCKLRGLPTLRLSMYDLWRCSDCKQVYVYRRWAPGGRNPDIIWGHHVKNCNHGCSSFCSYWLSADINKWLEAGGER